MSAESSAALAVNGLRVDVADGDVIVEDVSLSVAPGRFSVSSASPGGKTTTALALLGYARPGTRIVAGTIEVAGRRLSGLREEQARSLRGRTVSYVPQDHGNALNPALRIRAAVEDMLAAHATARSGSVTAALASVHLATDDEFLRRASALGRAAAGDLDRDRPRLPEPPLVVLDEPTTGLDVVTQARVLDEIARLRRERECRDGVRLARPRRGCPGRRPDRGHVRRAVVEEGPASAILEAPRHPYTRGLVQSIPDHLHRAGSSACPGWPWAWASVRRAAPSHRDARRRSSRCDSGAELEEIGAGRRVRCFEWQRTPPLGCPCAPWSGRWARSALLAVEGLRAVLAVGTSRSSRPRTCPSPWAPASVALVGESGSGKTTIARCVAGLHAPAAGQISLDGASLAGKARKREGGSAPASRSSSRTRSTLNPRHRVDDAIARPARMLRDLSKAEAGGEVGRLLERVRLPARLARFGRAVGRRAAAGCRRAGAGGPADVLVCDEITSGLGVSVQAAVLSSSPSCAIRSRAGAPASSPTTSAWSLPSPTACWCSSTASCASRDGRGRDRAPAGRLRDGSSRRLPACPSGSLVTRLAARSRLEDVAREAGVAKSFASRILNRTPGMTVRPETRQRVLDVARELRRAACRRPQAPSRRDRCAQDANPGSRDPRLLPDGAGRRDAGVRTRLGGTRGRGSRLAVA